ncbi:hypothetical protein [Streptomyces sp. NBC_01012]|uniref:hypothetical protein n=1 Tax=Streptomyces sp. NBC_01012 TaxID=2903717 RepID=UPI0038683362|nr:hypothetical protein OG623_14275 [Streptomyces sp. NBC_01012]
MTTHSRDTPSTPRRRPWYRYAPQGSRTFVLGLCAAVGGIAGAIRAVVEEGGFLEVAGTFAVGVLGVLLSVAWVLNQDRRS